MLALVLAAAVNWPAGYNAGVTAYRSNDFAASATAFEQATASPNRTLQQRALYNLGNTCYRLGEAQPPQAQQLWERAVKSYESALALEPTDVDAKFNHDFVKKKLEELKKQQEQQQQQKQNQQDQQDKQQDQKKDNQQQEQQQQKQQDEKQDQQQQQKPEPQDQQKPEESKAQDQQAEPQQLDKQQAKALLDNLREDERNWNFFPEVQMKDLKDSGVPDKDW